MAAADRFTERVTSTCKCGLTVEEDFFVIDPHALRSPNLRTRAEQTQHERSRTGQQPQPRRRSGLIAGIKECIYSQTEPQDTQSHSDEETIGLGPATDKLKDLEILHFCVPKGTGEGYIVKYIEFTARPASDKEFMERLRHTYYESNFPGFWMRFRWLSIYRVRSLHLVRFNILARDYALVSEKGSMPPSDDRSYVYSPKPLKRSIPGSEGILLHCFIDPSQCDSGLQIFSMTPRKLRDRVVYPSPWTEGEEGFGWGIQVEHCVNRKKIVLVWILFVYLMLGVSFFGLSKENSTV